MDSDHFLKELGYTVQDGVLRHEDLRVHLRPHADGPVLLLDERDQGRGHHERELVLGDHSPRRNSKSTEIHVAGLHWDPTNLADQFAVRCAVAAAHRFESPEKVVRLLNRCIAVFEQDYRRMHSYARERQRLRDIIMQKAARLKNVIEVKIDSFDGFMDSLHATQDFDSDVDCGGGSDSCSDDEDEDDEDEDGEDIDDDDDDDDEEEDDEEDEEDLDIIDDEEEKKDVKQEADAQVRQMLRSLEDMQKKAHQSYDKEKWVSEHEKFFNKYLSKKQKGKMSVQELKSNQIDIDLLKSIAEKHNFQVSFVQDMMCFVGGVPPPTAPLQKSS